MELRQLFAVIIRRWPLVVVPTLVVAVFAVATYRAPGPSFSTTLRFTAGQAGPPPAPPSGYDPNYTRWQASEYIVNTLGDWAKSSSFAAAVSAELATKDIQIPAAALQGAIAVDVSKSLLAIYVTWPDAAQLAAISEAIADVLQTQNVTMLPQLGGQAAVVAKLDTPVITPAVPSLRVRLELPLRLALGLAAGLALAFAVDYLDPTVRDKKELEGLGIEVIGEIPKK
ncbi:MAG: hypothetical protein HY023_08390 [Chloroflexi bacterium]|nr:hypothetical protein [Chloroflexota bacterium]